jgi:RNA polymerase sigma-70 factor (ECF subfamily)
VANAEQAAAVVTELFESWHEAMVRFADRSLGNFETAEEIVQEAFTDLYKELRSGKPVVHPKAWVMRVIRRRIWREYHCKEPVCEQLDLIPEVPAHMRYSGEIGLLLSHLTAREAEAMLLRAAGLDYTGIAEELGIATGTVGALLSKALRKMQGVAQGKGAGRVVES